MAATRATKEARRALDAEVKTLFDALVAELEAVRGEHAQEREIWVRAVHALIELRREAGHAAPTEFIPEILELEGMGPNECPFDSLRVTKKAESDRWHGYILEAIEQTAPPRARRKR